MLTLNPFRSVWLYTLIVMALFSVPSFFAIQSTVTEEKYKASQELFEWVATHEKSIFAKEEFDIPRSVRFHLNIYDETHTLLYRGIEATLEDVQFKIRVVYPFLYYQKAVQTDDRGLFFVVVQTKLNYA